MTRRTRRRYYGAPLLLLAGVVVTLLGAIDPRWNGIDLIGWIALIVGTMRVMRPVVRSPRA